MFISRTSNKEGQRGHFIPNNPPVSIETFSQRFPPHPVPQAKDSCCVASKDFPYNQLNEEPEWAVKPTPNLPLHPVCGTSGGFVHLQRPERGRDKLALWSKKFSFKQILLKGPKSRHSQGGRARKLKETCKRFSRPQPEERQYCGPFFDILPSVTFPMGIPSLVPHLPLQGEGNVLLLFLSDRKTVFPFLIWLALCHGNIKPEPPPPL